MKQVKYTLILLTLALNISTIGLGQQDSTNQKERMPKYHRLDASYIFGGQVYNDNFIYVPGYGFSISNGVLINKNISIGLGIGGQFYEDEKFLPIYLDLTAYRKAKKSKKHASFINTQIGYSIGWNAALSKLETYDFNGGAFINAGAGRKTKINDELSLLFQVSYRHQFAELSYKVSGIKDYSESLNYDMLVLTVGLLLEK